MFLSSHESSSYLMSRVNKKNKNNIDDMKEFLIGPDIRLHDYYEKKTVCMTGWCALLRRSRCA